MKVKVVETLNEKLVSNILPKRPKDANKGTFGKVLVIAGSENYPGAAYLACAAAYRVGAGLVTLATIPEVQNIVSKKLPEVTFIVLPEKEIYEKLYEYDAILIGPGLGKKESVRKFMQDLLRLYDLPNIVIDGDGLNILAEIKNWWEEIEEYGVSMVLTPHPGEMARLTTLSIEKIQSSRKNIAKKYAADIWGQVVVLKGANTIIASPTSEIKISTFANPALATAGTGDVLSGIIASFLAQGLDTNYGFDAACAGVYTHGMAGEMVKEKLGDAGMLASDLLPVLPKVLVNISKHRVS